MKASEMIERLQWLQKENGDQDVLIDAGMALHTIEEVDLDTEENGIIIWTGDMVEGI